MSDKIKGCIDLALAMFIVGSSVAAGKVVTSDMPVFLALELRFILAAILIIPILLRKEGRFPRLEPRTWLTLGMQTLTGVFLFNAFLLHGLKHTSAVSAGLITSTTPACMGIISVIFLKEKIGLRGIMGIICAVAGIMLVNVPGATAGSTSGESGMFGNLLVFGAVVGESMFLLLRKLIRQDLSPLAASSVICVLGVLAFFPPALCEYPVYDLAKTGLRAWAGIIYYAAAITVAAYILWFRGITKVSAETAAVITGIMPLSAMLISGIVLKETIGMTHLLAGACVTLAIFLISGAKIPLKGK